MSSIQKSKERTAKAKDVVLAIKAVKCGLPGVRDGEPVSRGVAASCFEHVSKSALQRMTTDVRCQAAIDTITKVELPESLDGEEMAILARSLYSLLPQQGRQGLLSLEEEFDLAKRQLQSSHLDHTLHTDALKAHALSIAQTNHPESPVTRRWSTSGVSDDWLRSFMGRWGHLMPFPSSDVADGYHATYDGVIEAHTLLQQIGEDVGEIVFNGQRRLSPRQVASLDEIYIQVTSKKAPVIQVNSAPEARNEPLSDDCESPTLLLTMFADGTPRVPPLVITDSEENTCITFEQPESWQDNGVAQALHGTMLQHAAVAWDPRACLTEATYHAWVRDWLIPALQYGPDGERDYWIVLIMDNAQAHITYESLRLLRDAKIHVVGFGPGIAELCQPLQRCMNTTLKSAMSAACAASTTFQAALEAGSCGLQDWLKLLAYPLEPQGDGDPTNSSSRDAPSALNAALSPDNCLLAFRQAGLAIDERVQYRPEWLRHKFDASGILNPRVVEGLAESHSEATAAREIALARIDKAAAAASIPAKRQPEAVAGTSPVPSAAAPVSQPHHLPGQTAALLSEAPRPSPGADTTVVWEVRAALDADMVEAERAAEDAKREDAKRRREQRAVDMQQRKQQRAAGKAAVETREGGGSVADAAAAQGAGEGRAAAGKGGVQVEERRQVRTRGKAGALCLAGRGRLADVTNQV